MVPESHNYASAVEKPTASDLPRPVQYVRSTSALSPSKSSLKSSNEAIICNKNRSVRVYRDDRHPSRGRLLSVDPAVRLLFKPEFKAQHADKG
jgi:hypothetical protein